MDDKVFLILIIAVLPLLLIIPLGISFTKKNDFKAKYAKLQVGMTYSHILNILGDPNEKSAISEDVFTAFYRCTGLHFFAASKQLSIILLFKENILTEKKTENF